MGGERGAQNITDLSITCVLKKSSSLNGRAIKRGGGPAIKEKDFFFNFFFLIWWHLKIEIILLYTTYRNMDISPYSLSVGIFTWLLKYFPKNRAILVQKLWEEKNFSLFSQNCLSN